MGNRRMWIRGEPTHEERLNAAHAKAEAAGTVMFAALDDLERASAELDQLAEELYSDSIKQNSRAGLAIGSSVEYQESARALRTLANERLDGNTY